MDSTNRELRMQRSGAVEQVVGKGRAADAADQPEL
jgi:hypothetical protein